MIVNKKELGKILGIDRSMIDDFIIRCGPDFPVVERGTYSRPWKFETDAVLPFVDRIRQRDQIGQQTRQARIRQLTPGSFQDFVARWRQLLDERLRAFAQQHQLRPEILTALTALVEQCSSDALDTDTR